MVVEFTCERCGKRFQIEERYGGKRGRCSQCGHVMRIPLARADEPAHPIATAAEHELRRVEAGEAKLHSEPEPAAPFRLSPPEFHPRFGHPATVNPPHAETAERSAPQRTAGPHDSVFALEHIDPGRIMPHGEHVRARFELLEDEPGAGEALLASPEIERGMRELEEFQRNRHGYELAGEHGKGTWFFGLGSSGPASWLRVKWRSSVGFVLKLLRWVDTWAYLISVPFLMLMIFGIVVQNAAFVHLGAVVVVLANYGRFWADLLAFFVRPTRTARSRASRSCSRPTRSISW